MLGPLEMFSDILGHSNIVATHQQIPLFHRRRNQGSTTMATFVLVPGAWHGG